MAMVQEVTFKGSDAVFSEDKFDTFEMAVVDLLMNPDGCEVDVELEVVDDQTVEGTAHGMDDAGQRYRVTRIVFEVTPILKE